MFDKNKVKLGIAPIAWTNDDMPDLGKENTFEQCVSEMALAGFAGSEVGNKYPKDPEVLKKALEPVSYTHLDVYKRQSFCRPVSTKREAFFLLPMRSIY